jgi:hypothetical protein
MRIDRIVERMDMIAGHTTSLFDRADALDRAANALRTEAAAATQDLMVLRRQLEQHITRELVRGRLRGASREISRLRKPA